MQQYALATGGVLAFCSVLNFLGIASCVETDSSGDEEIPQISKVHASLEPEVHVETKTKRSHQFNTPTVSVRNRISSKSPFALRLQLMRTRRSLPWYFLTLLLPCFVIPRQANGHMPGGLYPLDRSDNGREMETLKRNTLVAHYYLSPDGSDRTGNGSKSRPWRSIAFADSHISVPRGGTVVHVMPGTYIFGLFTTRKSGTPGGRIIWKSESIWRAKLPYSGWNVGGNYTDVEGFDIGPDPDAAAGWAAVVIAGDHVRVRRNYLHNKGDNQALGNKCPASAALAVQHTVHDALIDSNVIYSTGRMGGCLHAWGYYGISNHGIYLSGWHHIVTNNIISKAAGWGIHAYHNPCHDVIANNTIFYNFTGGIIISNPTDNAPPCTLNDYTSVINNLVVHNGWGSLVGGNRHGMGGILFDLDIGPHNTAYNNVMAGNRDSEGRLSNTISNISHQPLSQGSNVDAGSGYDALFVNYHDEYTGRPEDYQLSPGSAARHAGTTSGLHTCASPPGISPCVPEYDFEGTLRPKDSAPDAGAYQRY